MTARFRRRERTYVAIIIPARNEESPLPGVIAEIPPEAADNIIVVDNGSTDRTAEVAAQAGATVVVEPRMSLPMVMSCPAASLPLLPMTIQA
jgi:cellulose synthase/poly-beta-1,6-N-acetylglucosamine synthase-like glycosyltransferase